MEIVLVHGGWQGGWAWDGVAAELRAAGHDVWAPTLIGSEDGPRDRSAVTLSTIAESLIAALEERGTERLVLIGHSGGGPVVQLVAQALGDRVDRAIFVDAWVLADGESINDVVPAENVEGVRALAATTPDGSVPMPAELWSAAFMQDATAAELDAVLPRLVPVPFGWLDERVSIAEHWDRDLITGYLFLDDDLGMPSEIYESSAARLRDPLIGHAPGSHQAMLTRASELAKALLPMIES